VNGEQDQAAGDGRGERMILYHYTGYYELQNGGTILKEACDLRDVRMLVSTSTVARPARRLP
jgi:hypothetical protein